MLICVNDMIIECMMPIMELSFLNCINVYTYFRMCYVMVFSLSGVSYNSPIFFRYVGIVQEKTLLFVCSLILSQLIQGRATPKISLLSELLYFVIHLYFDVEPIFCFAVQRVCNMSVVSHVDYDIELCYVLKTEL